MNPSTIQERSNPPAVPVSAGMSLDEARQVKWLRSRPKPLGELWDEGYLDASRLEWAAKKAYNPRLKEAARVLLEGHAKSPLHPVDSKGPRASPSEIKEPIRVAMRLEEARSTLWPFGALRDQPMGDLSDSRKLSLKDLAYAVENAREECIRQAAIAIMLERLDQEIEEPRPPAGLLRVVAAKRSYSERRQLWLASLEGLISGGVLAVGVMLFINSLIGQRPPGAHRLQLAEVFASPELTMALLMVIVGLLGVSLLATLGLDWLMKRLDKQIEAYRRGEEGEEAVIEKARRALDGNWVLFRDVVLPGRRRTDIDVVLVGPPGVWAIEVKTWHGHYRNVGEAWQHRAGSQWKQMRKSPSRQASAGATALKSFLRADGIKTYVPEAVAWADQTGRITLEDPTVPVWTLDRLEDELGNLSNGRGLSEADRERIVQKLTRLCQARKKGAW